MSDQPAEHAPEAEPDQPAPTEYHLETPEYEKVEEASDPTFIATRSQPRR